jgi:hypothetical protein
MAKDLENLFFKLKEAGYQGFGSSNNPIRSLIQGPVTVRDFLIRNAKDLAETKKGLLGALLDKKSKPGATPGEGEGEDDDMPTLSSDPMKKYLDTMSKYEQMLEKYSSGPGQSRLEFIPTYQDTYDYGGESIEISGPRGQTYSPGGLDNYQMNQGLYRGLKDLGY